MKKILWNNDVKKNSYNGKVIYSNCNNGEWIRIGNDISDVIEYYIKNGCEDSNVRFFNPEDKKTFDMVMTQMEEIGVLVDKRQPKQNGLISFELTSKCNLHCIHCCVDAGKISPNELKKDEWIVAFDKAIQWNPRAIMLSGGEPMIRKDFFELLKYLRVNYSGKIVVSTNGTLISEDNVVELVKNSDEIDISLDGYDEKSCSVIRGKGVFNKVINSINLLHKNGFDNIVLSMAIGSKNSEWEEEFLKLNERLGTDSMVRLFSPVGRGEESKDLFLNDDEYELYIPKDYLNKEDNDFRVSCCSAGKFELFVSCDGSIYPCPSYFNDKYILGNVLDKNTLNDVVINCSHEFLIKKAFDNNSLSGDKCLECPVSEFCWTCPGTINEIKTQDALDKYCNKMFSFLTRKIWEE